MQALLTPKKLKFFAARQASLCFLPLLLKAWLTKPIYMTEKRFFRALFKTMLFFAFLHIILLVVLTIVNGQLSYVNVFQIVGLQYFFPGIDKGPVSFLLSLAVIAVIYFFFYRKHGNKN